MNQITEEHIIDIARFWCYQMKEELIGFDTHLIPSAFVICNDDLPAKYNRGTGVPTVEKYGHKEILVLMTGIIVQNGKLIGIQSTTVFDWNEKKILKVFDVIKADEKIFD